MNKILYILIVLLSHNYCIFAQLYKCDSTYLSSNRKIEGGFKNGLKHGSWTYYSDSMQAVKFEEYWLGELISTTNKEFTKDKMFNESDSIIEYNFGVTFKHVLSKVIKPDFGYYFYCELDDNFNDSLTLLNIHKLKIPENGDDIYKFSLLTNRYIILDSLRIPILTSIDRKFAKFNWVFTGCDYWILLDKFNRIIEITN